MPDSLNRKALSKLRLRGKNRSEPPGSVGGATAPSVVGDANSAVQSGTNSVLTFKVVLDRILNGKTHPSPDSVDVGLWMNRLEDKILFYTAQETDFPDPTSLKWSSHPSDIYAVHTLTDKELGLKITVNWTCQSTLEGAEYATPELMRLHRIAMAQSTTGSRMKIEARDWRWLLDRAVEDVRNSSLVSEGSKVHAIRYANEPPHVLKLTLPGKDVGSGVTIDFGDTYGSSLKAEGDDDESHSESFVSKVRSLAGKSIAPGESQSGLKNVGPTEISIHLWVRALSKEEVDGFAKEQFWAASDLSELYKRMETKGVTKELGLETPDDVRAFFRAEELAGRSPYPEVFPG